jgi:RNA polymerase sigma-70 factor (ECF subfamily)
MMAVEAPTMEQIRIDEDRELALAARAREDSEAFAQLYDLYVTRVYRFAYRRLGNHADAEDLTAQTFHRALEALPRYQDRGLPFGAWLFRIARNLLIDRQRLRPESLRLDARPDFELTGDLEAIPEDASELHEQLDSAWAAVARLPALQRRAIVLRYAQELSHAEVGRRIGRSEAATKQIVYRAIKTLRDRLGARAVTECEG